MMPIKLKYLLVCFIVSSPLLLTAQITELRSPNGKAAISVHKQNSQDYSSWYLIISYGKEETNNEVIPKIDLGLSSGAGEFTDNLKLLKVGKPGAISESYTALHGKRSLRSNSATEKVVSFENAEKVKFNVILRAYNDGVCFRYEFPGKRDTFKVTDELTAYTISNGTNRWLQKFNPANEGYYRKYTNASEQKDWAYPALFLSPDSNTWFLIHEADLDRNYCGSKLTNYKDTNQYKITFPDDWNGRGHGQPEPVIAMPWKSPWRVIIMGSLGDIVESTLVDDVSPPSRLQNTDWIKPGLVSWNYWSNNHGTKDYQVVCKFADLAAHMGWPYTLLDWEWDAMGNGGNLPDALDYIHSLGVKPLIWYNSGGDHTWVQSTPKDRMLTHENRVEEFTKLKKMGIAGVKVDFFESEKQDMINYYLDIVEDAADYQMMVYFHGCLVPRGWGRTYPNLMTYEGVRGAEWYNNVPDFTFEAPVHNTILPFTRNVVGAMDYTPVTFTNSQHPHITSYVHELALGVLFESGLQHLADRPDGYYALPDAAKTLLRDLPVAWDDIKYLQGFPGEEVALARRKADQWYIAGINAEDKVKQKTISLSFLPEGIKYRLCLITDGEHDKELAINYRVVENTNSIDIKMLRRGGFIGYLEPLQLKK